MITGEMKQDIMGLSRWIVRSNVPTSVWQSIERMNWAADACFAFPTVSPLIPIYGLYMNVAKSAILGTAGFHMGQLEAAILAAEYDMYGW